MGARPADKTVTETFTVLSKHPIKGVAKGGTVTLTARPGAINCLLIAGAIEPVAEAPIDVKKAPVKVAEKKVAE